MSAEPCKAMSHSLGPSFTIDMEKYIFQSICWLGLLFLAPNSRDCGNVRTSFAVTLRQGFCMGWIWCRAKSSALSPHGWRRLSRWWTLLLPLLPRNRRGLEGRGHTFWALCHFVCCPCSFSDGYCFFVLLFWMWALTSPQFYYFQLVNRSSKFLLSAKRCSPF